MVPSLRTNHQPPPPIPIFPELFQLILYRATSLGSDGGPSDRWKPRGTDLGISTPTSYRRAGGTDALQGPGDQQEGITTGEGEHCGKRGQATVTVDPLVPRPDQLKQGPPLTRWGISMLTTLCFCSLKTSPINFFLQLWPKHPPTPTPGCVLHSQLAVVRAHPVTHTQKANVRHLLTVETNMMQNPVNIGTG